MLGVSGRRDTPPHHCTGQLDEAEKAGDFGGRSSFGDDYYLELQRHKATAPRANHETFPLQQQCERGAYCAWRPEKHGIKVICTNDVALS